MAGANLFHVGRELVVKIVDQCENFLGQEFLCQWCICPDFVRVQF